MSTNKKSEIKSYLKANVTNEEFDAIAAVHKMSNRLNIGIRFDWTKSIDVRRNKASEIIDESFFKK